MNVFSFLLRILGKDKKGYQDMHSMICRGEVTCAFTNIADDHGEMPSAFSLTLQSPSWLPDVTHRSICPWLAG